MERNIRKTNNAARATVALLYVAPLLVVVAFCVSGCGADVAGGIIGATGQMPMGQESAQKVQVYDTEPAAPAHCDPPSSVYPHWVCN